MSAARRRTQKAALPPRARMLLVASVGMLGLSGAAISATLPGGGSSKAGSTEVDESREDASREEILEYWTPERIKQAKPAEMPVYPVECTGWGQLIRPHCW
ncbi:hypothetical protein ABT009_40020 [Streptomyces sp. NPDC002896]|uniref:hypothetical protein n=1 Tax=Streptomyces sp. NPDC002896 TaxID=3154438 RepID=UPI00331782EF